MNSKLASQVSLEVDAAAQHTSVPALTLGMSFFRRMFSYVLDVGVLYTLLFLASLVTGVVISIATDTLPSSAPTAVVPTAAFLLGELLDLLMVVSYFTLFEWFFGATPGKAMLGMQVVRQDGSPCTFKRALIRGFARIVDGLVFGAVAAFHMRRPLNLRWGDKLAGTIVVSANDPGIHGRRSWSRFALAVVLEILLLAVFALLLHGLH